MEEWEQAWIALGSNLGDRAGTLMTAREALDTHSETRVRAASGLWETEPVGPPGQDRYLNAVVAVETKLDARTLLKFLLLLERDAGRNRSDQAERWGPRELDLDLLLFGEECIREAGLEVPHPRMHARRFVLAPLCEIAADQRHPRLGRSMGSLLDECSCDAHQVWPWREAGPWSFQAPCRAGSASGSSESNSLP